ncbi:hypothetical protein QJ856_gp0494 [Tupanvirus deep ocean]|uniref:Uncharacterized protein n=2 Tax=Tupanvirus TaxID=2094720 RepID=A0AC62A908_9VIRU|nr:hypothetical protein QJ856_gp0494 [Tupanvirus deep ocean]QKU34250.1 hypothetical protein [Tupanvirus deep ocean]
MLRIGIIGTAGRKPQDYNILSVDHMKWMADNVKSYINHVLETTTDNIILVSGGSAWADHVAVQLYLEGNFGGLELYLPTTFNTKTKKFENTHEGRTLNFLHGQCADKTKCDIFGELSQVVSSPNVKVVVKRGFFARNTLISQNCDHLIAFTFGENAPIDGGTFDTWKKTKHENKIHFSLSDA